MKELRRKTDLDGVHAALTVRTVMTPRGALKGCRIGDDLRALWDRYHQSFDALVVRDAETGRTVGLQWIDGLDRPAVGSRVRKYERPSSYVAPDDSILEAARRFQERSVLLVKAGDQVAGLVTLSDLERLPSRLALFAHAQELERLAGEFIHRAEPDPTNWAPFLEMSHPGVAENIWHSLRKAKGRERLGDMVLALGFRDKASLANELLWRRFDRRGLWPDFEGIIQFRNDLAHGVPFQNPKEAAGLVLVIDGLSTTLNEHLR